jgi:hypothetical protein
MEQHNNYIADETGKYFLRDGIIHCVYHENTVIDLPTIKRVIINRNIVAAGIPRPLLVDGRGVIYWTREAKHYTWANKKSLLFITAIAPVVTSLPIQISVNWVINFLPPSLPIKVFTEISPAIEWLEEYKIRRSIRELVEK